MAWVWPILIWSAIGNREVHNNVQQLTFSSASPLWRQLPAQWLAGFIVTLLMGSGAALRFFVDGDTDRLARIAFRRDLHPLACTSLRRLERNQQAL